MLLCAAVIAAAALAGCAVTAALRDDRVLGTLAFLDAPGTTRASVVARMGVPSMQDPSWVRYESRTGLHPAASNRTLVVTFDEDGSVSDYRYTGVTGCVMPPVLGALPDDDLLAEVCREGVTKSEALERYLLKNPQLTEFVSSPSCAVLQLVVGVYQIVTRFQEVAEIQVG